MEGLHLYALHKDIDSLREKPYNTLMMEIEREKRQCKERSKEVRQKILDGTYSSRVVQGRQNKHIQGTKEFEQKREQIKKADSRNEPAILEVDAQTLVNRYKGSGSIELRRGQTYPRETITIDEIVGKTWLRETQRYMDVNAFQIQYSSTGVHVFPVYSKKGGR